MRILDLGLPDLADALRSAGFSPDESAGFAPFRPLRGAAADLPPFPVDALPEPLWDLVSCVSDATETDDAMAAAFALAAVAACVHGTFCVSGPAEYAWSEANLSLFVGVVADPSERKSAVAQRIFGAIRRAESARNTDPGRAAEVAAYRDELSVTRSRIEAAQSKAAKARTEDDLDGLMADVAALRRKERDLEDAPVLPVKICCGDCTPEALIDLMGRNDGRIALLTDESDAIMTACGMRYSKSANPGPLLDAYSGSPIEISRRGAGDRVISRTALTIGVGLQPTAWRELAGDDYLRGRGLLSRFLIAIPRSKVGRRKLTNPQVPGEITAAYEDLIGRLIDIEGTGREIFVGRGAFDVLDRWYRTLDQRLLEDLYPVRWWCGKLHGQVLRIAALFHAIQYMEDADRVEISTETVEAAVRVGEYFLVCAQIAFDGPSDAVSTDAAYIWRRLRASGADRLSKHELLQKCQRFKGRTDDMDAALALLAEHGYVRVERSSRGRGRPSETIVLNPEALTL